MSAYIRCLMEYSKKRFLSTPWCLAWICVLPHRPTFCFAAVYNLFIHCSSCEFRPALEKYFDTEQLRFLHVSHNPLVRTILSPSVACRLLQIRHSALDFKRFSDTVMRRPRFFDVSKFSFAFRLLSRLDEHWSTAAVRTLGLNAAFLHNGVT